MGFQETISGLLGPAPNPNHAIHPGQGQKTRPCPRLPKPPTRGILPRSWRRTEAQATSALPDKCGYSQQDISRRQPQERGREAPKIPESAAPALPRASWRRHSLSVISPRPWAYSRSLSLVTSSFSSLISLLLGSSLMMALQRICLARSAYLGSKKKMQGLRDKSIPKAQGCSELYLESSWGEKSLT